MGTVYWIQIADMSTSDAVELNHANYLSLQQARQTLIDLNAFEQKYEILLNNYRDFEIYCASQSLVSVTSSHYSYLAANGVLAEVNRMFMNFLTAHQSYVDQVVQDFKHLELGEQLLDTGVDERVSFKDVAERQLSATYDGSKDYRLICALRNHAQHSAAPIHGVRGQGKVCWAESLIFYSTKTVLAQNRKFKASAMDEIDEQIDIRATSKKAMEQVSAAHVKLRKTIQTHCDAARTAIENAHTDMAKEVGSGDKVYALWLCCREPGSEEFQRATLMLQWDDARKALQEKNRHAIATIRV